MDCDSSSLLSKRELRCHGMILLAPSIGAAPPRYPSDLTDREWAIVEPFLLAAKRGQSSPYNKVAQCYRCHFVYSVEGLPMAYVTERLPAPIHGSTLFLSLAKQRFVIGNQS